ncbi:MAG: hypothetical protein K1X82_01725 [Bacteroidia bacterium]|nr:hypothetical protein [Bacteroidia bacterium]
MIESLLHLSKLEIGRLNIKLVDLHQLALQVLEENKPYPNPNLHCTIDSLPPINTDPILLHHVLFKLIENAIKFSSKREYPKIKISSFLSSAEIRISIKDNGVGFDMAEYDKLFGTFKRLQSGNEYQGDGLGLVYCKNAISKLGGRIWAQSILEEGSEFSFTLPYSCIPSSN